MIKNLIFSLLLTFANAHGQVQALSFEELASKNSIAPRPIVILLYTATCPVCQIQHQQISGSIQKILNKQYYFVDFNAETRSDIQFNSKPYRI